MTEMFFKKSHRLKRGDVLTGQVWDMIILNAFAQSGNYIRIYLRCFTFPECFDGEIMNIHLTLGHQMRKSESFVMLLSMTRTTCKVGLLIFGQGFKMLGVGCLLHYLTYLGLIKTKIMESNHI